MKPYINRWLKTINDILAIALYNLAYTIDGWRKRIEEYGYETAPYCGHYYSGHHGWLTRSNYHEGDGSKQAHCFLYQSHYHTEERKWRIFLLPDVRIRIRQWLGNGLFWILCKLEREQDQYYFWFSPDEGDTWRRRKGRFTSEHKVTKQRKLLIGKILFMYRNANTNHRWKAIWFLSREQERVNLNV